MAPRACRPRPRAALLALALLAAAAAAAADEPPHDRAFWMQLRAQAYAVPAGQPVLPLALEAAHLLGTTDAVLRDAVGYDSLVTWVYKEHRLDCAGLARLRAALLAGASAGLGEPEGDGLFGRSFSALALSVLAAADLENPCLDAEAFNRLLDAGLDALARERDLRGWVPGKGWGHATAHAADLLKFLGRSPQLTTAQQARIVAGIAARLRSAGQVFVWGEDARLAAALAALVRRADADPAPIETWARQLATEHATVWREPFDAARATSERAALNTLAELAANLDDDRTGGAALRVREALRAMRAATR
jgi:Protein of unknown function (DUF2785)